MSLLLTEPTEALGMDAEEQKKFIKYFHSLPPKPSPTIRFFNHNEFYSLNGEDAHLAAKSMGNIIKCMGSESDAKLDYVVLKKSQFEQFVRELLLIRQYRVEVYIKSSENNSWSVEYKGSPGNLSQFEEILFDCESDIPFSNAVLGIRIVRGTLLAVASVNTVDMRMDVVEVNDNDAYTELEAIIAQIGPRECVIPEGDSTELRTLVQVLERNTVSIARVKRADFSDKDLKSDLDRLLYFADDQDRNSDTLMETKLENAMGSLQAVIKFLNLANDEQNYNQYKLAKLDVHRFVRLDNAALYSLNILRRPNQESTSRFADRTSSVYGILNSCTTNQGRRLLEQWIKQPLKDENLIRERYDVVECFVKDTMTRKLLSETILTRLNDLVLLAKKLAAKKATLKDCYRVYQIVGNVGSLIQVLENTCNSSITSMLVDPMKEISIDLEKFQTMIEETLDLTLVDRDEFLIKKDVDEELNELYEKKERIEEKLQKLTETVSHDLDLVDDKSVRLDYIEQHGYLFRVTAKDETFLRKNSKYKIVDAIKSGIRFTTNKLQELSEEYKDIKSTYEEQQKNIIQEVFDVAAGYADTLRTLNIYTATVDVLVSFANVAIAARIPFARPKLHPLGGGIIRLEKLRHPCVEQQEHIAFIPNSIDFDAGNKIFHIITGPNMCGKSTFIRSVGVCVLMAQIGSFVPCDQAEITIVDAIYSRVGADDCPIRGLSTFMLEMIEATTITKSATKDSLVIIDELGRGTSTNDGCGIAWAIAEYLIKEVKCFGLFATHFHEIIRLGHLYPSANNLHVTAVTTENTITPLYQIRNGECDSSYGIHCAKMADFPDDVLQWAIDHQKSLEHSAGMQFITDFEGSLKRKAIEEGDEIIGNAMKKIKELDFEKLNDDELKNQLMQIKDEMVQSGNLFVKGLLT